MTKYQRSQECTSKLIKQGKGLDVKKRVKRVIPFYETMPAGIVTGKVFIYLNLRSKVFSVRQGRFVVAHCHNISVKGAHFKVSEKVRQWVIRNNKKSVHAGIEGEIVEHTGKLENNAMYNPRKYKQFVDVQSKEELTGSFDHIAMYRDSQSGYCKVTY